MLGSDPVLKGNLHAHSTLSDGAFSPAEVAEKYRALGYDFLAFTDHRSFIGEGEEKTREYWSKLPQSTPELIILTGVEEEPKEIRFRHLGVIRAGAEELRILNHPSEYGLSVEETTATVLAAGAHAVEVTCHGRYLHRYDTEEIPAQKIATDDAHYEREIGISWIEVDAERDPESILRAIKAGRFSNHIGRGR